MSALGDLITVLSTNTPLGATGQFVSQPFITTEYNSYSLIMYSDIDTSVTVQWSSDSIHWDYSQKFHYNHHVATQTAVPVVDKWIRIIIDNISAVQSFIMRFSAYASPVNNSVEITVPDGVVIDVNVRNSFNYAELGNLMVNTIDPYNHYQFNYGTGTTAGDFSPGYLDLTAEQSGKSPTGGWYIFGTGSVLLIDTGDNSSYSFINSLDNLSWIPGVGINCDFSAAFSLNPLGGAGTSTLLCGAGHLDTNGQPLEGIYIGYYGSSSAVPSGPLNLIFSIVVYSENLPGGISIYHQNLWNLDNCSGNHTMPLIDDWSLFNQFKITFLPNGNAVVSIMNPETGRMVPCQFINFTNRSTKSTFLYPFFGFNMYQESFSDLPASTTSGVNVNNWNIGYQSKPPTNLESHYSPIIYNNPISTAIPYPHDAIIYYLVNSPTFNGKTNYLNLFIDTITMGFKTTVPTYFGLYKNLNVTGGTGIYVDQQNSPAIIYQSGASGVPHTPVIVGNLPTNSVFSGLVHLTSASYVSTEIIDISHLDIRLTPGETLSIVVFTVGHYTLNYIASSIGYHQNH